MVWQSDNGSGGFSDVKPWLPVPASHLQKSAARQANDPDGLLAHYQRALALRHGFPALAKGAQDGMKAVGAVLSFVRSYGDEVLFIAANLSDQPATTEVPQGSWRAIEAPDQKFGGNFVLGPWAVVILKRS